MDNVKDDRYFLEKITSDLKFVIDHTQGMTQEEMTEKRSPHRFRHVPHRAGGGKRREAVQYVPHGASRYPVGSHPRDAQPHRAQLRRREQTIVYDTVINHIPKMYAMLKAIMEEG